MYQEVYCNTLFKTTKDWKQPECLSYEPNLVNYVSIEKGIQCSAAVKRIRIRWFCLHKAMEWALRLLSKKGKLLRCIEFAHICVPGSNETTYQYVSVCAQLSLEGHKTDNIRLPAAGNWGSSAVNIEQLHFLLSILYAFVSYADVSYYK